MLIQKLIPSQDRILVKVQKSGDTTASGLYIPAAAKTKPQQGEVLSVGEGRTLASGVTLPVKFKVGDIVFFPEYSGLTIKLGEDVFLVMKEDDVMGVIVTEEVPDVATEKQGQKGSKPSFLSLVEPSSPSGDAA